MSQCSCTWRGQCGHEQIIETGSDVFVRNSLVDICAKCGSTEDECRVFSKMPFRNVISGNSILVGFAMHWQVTSLGSTVSWHICLKWCCLSSVSLWRCRSGGWRHALLWCHELNLQDFWRVRTLHLHGWPSWLCWPSAADREYDQVNALTKCSCVKGFDWCFAEFAVSDGRTCC